MSQIVRAVIWDMDGTLVDTAELHFRAWAVTLAQLNRSFTRDDFRATFGRRNPDIITLLFGGQFSPAEAALWADRKEAFYRDLTRQAGVDLLDGVRGLLDEAKSNHWRMAVGSSAPRANIELILELTQTRGHFDALVASEDTSKGKPDPEVFLTAAERLGCDPRACVVMEDAVAGVEAARRAGMRCVAVAHAGHHAPAALTAAGAALVVGHWSELTLADLTALFTG
jgi:beta-phosphoglucomutase